MPDLRGKLVEILTDDYCPLLWMQGEVTNLANYLIAHGVTVQEWISVKDRLPQEDERVLVWIGNNRYNDVRKDTDRVHNGKWVRWGGCVTHWMPWDMPQPPKEGT